MEVTSETTARQSLDKSWTRSVATITTVSVVVEVKMRCCVAVHTQSNGGTESIYEAQVLLVISHHHTFMLVEGVKSWRSSLGGCWTGGVITGPS